MSAPFVVMGMPRSRTFWLSRFLSYGDYSCEHEAVGRFRGLDDVKSWLSQNFTGACETAAGPFWRIIPRYRPDVKIAVVLRPTHDVVDSIMRVDMKGVAAFDPMTLRRSMEKNEAKLRQIVARIPGAIAVTFAELATEEGCKRIFEHCLPYRFDQAWWQSFAGVNLQCSVPATVRYFKAHNAQIDRLRAIAKQAILTDFALQRPMAKGGVGIGTEPFETFYRDGASLFAEHMAEVGEHPGHFGGKNVDFYRAIDAAGNLQMTVARQNGRMFGYLMTVESPSFETEGERIGAQTLRYASPLMPGLGMRLHRAALANSKSRGLAEVFSRAGTRGDGERVSAIYRRCGSMEDGALYRTNLRGG